MYTSSWLSIARSLLPTLNAWKLALHLSLLQLLQGNTLLKSSGPQASTRQGDIRHESLVFCGCHSKVPQSGWPKRTAKIILKNYSLSSGSKKSKERCCKGQVLSEGFRGGPFLACSSSGSPGIVWPVAASLQPSLPPSDDCLPCVSVSSYGISSMCCVFKFPSYKDISHTGLGSTLTNSSCLSL